MNWLDPVGAGLSLLCTYYFTQAKRSAWLIAIPTIVINLILYLQKQLYGQLLLEGIYFITMIYGWFGWGSSRPMDYLKPKQIITLSLLTFVSILILSQCLFYWTDSQTPYWDATATCLSLLAQILLCFKFIDCWILWFIADAFVAGLQWYKNIPFHSSLHTFYLIMAVLGFYRWRKLASA